MGALRAFLSPAASAASAAARASDAAAPPVRRLAPRVAAVPSGARARRGYGALRCVGERDRLDRLDHPDHVVLEEGDVSQPNGTNLCDLFSIAFVWGRKWEL